MIDPETVDECNCCYAPLRELLPMDNIWSGTLNLFANEEEKIKWNCEVCGNVVCSSCIIEDWCVDCESFRKAGNMEEMYQEPSVHAVSQIAIVSQYFNQESDQERASNDLDFYPDYDDNEDEYIVYSSDDSSISDYYDDTLTTTITTIPSLPQLILN